MSTRVTRSMARAEAENTAPVKPTRRTPTVKNTTKSTAPKSTAPKSTAKAKATTTTKAKVAAPVPPTTRVTRSALGDVTNGTQSIILDTAIRTTKKTPAPTPVHILFCEECDSPCEGDSELCVSCMAEKELMQGKRTRKTRTKQPTPVFKLCPITEEQEEGCDKDNEEEKEEEEEEEGTRRHLPTSAGVHTRFCDECSEALPVDSMPSYCPSCGVSTQDLADLFQSVTIA